MPLDALLFEPSEHALRCFALQKHPFCTMFQDNGLVRLKTKPSISDGVETDISNHVKKGKKKKEKRDQPCNQVHWG